MVHAHGGTTGSKHLCFYTSSRQATNSGWQATNSGWPATNSGWQATSGSAGPLVFRLKKLLFWPKTSTMFVGF